VNEKKSTFSLANKNNCAGDLLGCFKKGGRGTRVVYGGRKLELRLPLCKKKREEKGGGKIGTGFQPERTRRHRKGWGKNGTGWVRTRRARKLEHRIQTRGILNRGEREYKETKQWTGCQSFGFLTATKDWNHEKKSSTAQRETSDGRAWWGK